MPPITFAHRGGAADRRENTLAAFRYAQEAGATGIESDVRLSGDGIPVLAHDATLWRGLRRARVERTEASELSGWEVPTLAELYQAVGPDLDLSLDLKVDAAGPAAIDVARAAGEGALERLWLCSPDLGVLQRLRAEEPRVRLVHSTTRKAIDENIERHASTLAETRIDAFNLHRREWSTGLVVLFHRFDVRAFAWDVQEVRHLREVLTYGIDAVYSDHVHRMVATVAEWSAQT